MVGLTGGIASGKSSVRRAFEERGVATVDADAIAREVVAPGSPVLRAIVDRYGAKALLSDGTLNRAFVREQTLGSPENTQWLNAQTHPAIGQLARERLQAASGLYVVYEVPLLVETGGFRSVNRVLIVEAPREARLQRASVRDGVAPSAIEQIMKRQSQTHQRVSVAHDVVHNSRNLDDLHAQVKELDQLYRRLAA